MKKDALILVRGGGDLATGTIHRLWSAGLRVLVLEAEHPAAIRRQVSLCEAVYEGETAVEGLRAVRIETLAQAEEIWKQNAVPVLVSLVTAVAAPPADGHGNRTVRQGQALVCGSSGSGCHGRRGCSAGRIAAAGSQQTSCAHTVFKRRNNQ